MAAKGTTEIPTPRDVACAIVGGEPPEWLVNHFQNWAPAVMLERALAEMRYTRSHAKEWLANVGRAAHVLCCSLGYEPARGLLEGPELGPIPDLGDLFRMLAAVEGRVEAALNSPMLKTQDGTAPKGRGRAAPKEVNRPKVSVAAMIVLAYQEVRKRKPGARNRAAAEAADLYWRYTASLVSQRVPSTKEGVRGEDRLTKWRSYFEAALAEEPIFGRNHEEYLRHLRLGRELEAQVKADIEPGADRSAGKPKADLQKRS